MTSVQKNSIFSKYFAWVIKNFQELQKQNQLAIAYRIVGINKKNHQLTIQVIGKNSTFKAFPHEIAADENLINYFSPKDVLFITYDIYKKNTRPKYKILAKDFCASFNKMIFSIGADKNKLKTQKTAAELSANEKLLNQLSQKEAMLIGYTAASEKFMHDTIEKRKLHNKIIQKYEITSQEYSTHLNKIIYTLKNEQTKHTLQKTADQIASNKTLLKSLNHKDIYSIGYVSATEKTIKNRISKQKLHNKTIPRFKIVLQEYCKTIGKIIYTLIETTTKNKTQKTAAQITANKKTLRGLNSTDAHLIGYTTSLEHNHKRECHDKNNK